MTAFLHRAMAWIVAAAVAMGAGGTSIAPPPVDAAMVERSLAGAEWLAAQAKALPADADLTGAEDLIAWLLEIRGGMGADREAFSAHLAANGYGEPLLAVQRWLAELVRVAAAAEAASRAGELRSPAEIQAELRTLPTIPLDEAGEAERDRLIEELGLAGIPEETRKLGATAAARLAALRAMAGIEEAQ